MSAREVEPGGRPARCRSQPRRGEGDPAGTTDGARSAVRDADSADTTLTRWPANMPIAGRCIAALLEPVTAPALSPIECVRGGRFWGFAAVVAALIVVVLFWPPYYPVGVLAAIALPILLARHPAALSAGTLILAQEVPRRLQVGAVTSLGNESYYAGKVPLILILCCSVFVVIVFRLWPLRVGQLSTPLKVIVLTVATLILLALVAGFVDGQGLLSAINQNARPFIACAVGLVIGLGLRRLPGEERTTEAVAGIVLVGLTVIGVVAAAFGKTVDPRVSRYFIYYDSALPALGVVVFLALVTGRSHRDWRSIVVMAACLVLVLISFRRAVWLAATVPLAATLLLVSSRLHTLRRLAVATAGLLAALVIVPGLARDLQARLFGAPASAEAAPSPGPRGGTADPGTAGSDSGIVGTTEGQPPIDPAQVSGATAEGSTAGHVGDLKVGWKYVTEHWLGIGPRTPQLPGLSAVNSKIIYIHDEWLLDWFRFGPLAPLLVSGFLALLLLMAVRLLLQPEAGTIERAAAFFALVTPVCLILFPYFTTTTRWPLLLGITAGVLGTPRSEPTDCTAERSGRRAHAGRSS